MKVDREQLMRDGFIVLRQVIPPDKLEALRAHYETLIERRGGRAWLSEGAQPRISIVPHVDPGTADAAEIWLHENTLGVANQLITQGRPAPTSLWCMCSPIEDHGPAAWHRDIHPIDMAPMRLLQLDLLENGPRYLQWNIPLYDDNVLWVVPGSHVRINTAQENEELLADPRAPLNGGIPVELAAGDGVVYVNFLLHWGSNYSSKLRRTLHGGHSIFTDNQANGCAQHLSASARQQIEGWGATMEENEDKTERTLRAALDADEATFELGLEELQPGSGAAGKRVLTIFLCKAAQLMRIATRPDLEDVPEALQRMATGSHPISLNWGPEFAERFSAAEIEKLWQRFEFVDTRLLHTEEHFVPGYQSGPMQYFFEDLPEPFEVSDFVASWS